ncbi:phage head morphogenesis protein [Serratia nevei]|uniref:phage head morphogenesis protein n=1 Tax=Serratia nevei TaxID=2703794 RepID=UPI0028614054|nr:phage minor head protein [Serratia nevei]MDR8533008.1 phage minor head protein [Serratia nevei]
MPQTVDLGYAARLPPKEAVAYFRAKGYNISWNWYEQLTDAHARAFTVAKAARMDVLTTLRTEVDRAIHDGITRDEFINTLTPRLQKLGWWGKQIAVDSQGNAKAIQLGSPRRLALIYDVNTRAAYNAGRYAQMMNTADAFPYWQYVAVMDSRTRPAHAALNLMVFRFDDPFWKTHYPPNGWRCRCRVRALSAARLKELGLKVSYGASFIQTKTVDAGIDETTGEIFQTASTTFNNGKVNMTPDVGWSYNPGSAAFSTDQSMIRKMIEVPDAGLRQQIVQVLNGSRERQLAFSLWAKRTLGATSAFSTVQALGLVSESVADAVNARTGQPVPRLLAMNAGSLMDAPAARRLTTADAARLATITDSPAAVLWDPQQHRLLYVTHSSDADTMVVAEVAISNGKAAEMPEALTSAYRQDVATLQRQIAHGDYQIIQGTINQAE